MMDHSAGVPGVDLECVLLILLVLHFWEQFLSFADAFLLNFRPHSSYELVDVRVHSDGEAQSEFQR